jgi:pentose-5-phosphate-3-epimerase
LFGARLQIKDLGVKAGVVLNPGTSLTAIEEVRNPLHQALHK